MLTSVRSLMAATVLAGAALTATPAMAQDDLGISVSGNVAMTTDYRFRGIGLSDGDVAIQGGIDLGTDVGIYVGTWGSSLANSDSSVVLDDGAGNAVAYDVGGYGAAEVDIYGGWSGDVGGVSLDIGAIYYLYPNARNDFDAVYDDSVLGLSGYPEFDGYVGYPTDYIEAYGSIGGSFGPADLTLGVAYAPEQDSLGGADNFYIYTDLGVAIPNTPISLAGHVGYTDGYLTVTNDGNAVDWSVGATVTVLGGLELGVAYVGVEDDGLNAPGFTDDTVVGTIGFSF